MTTPNPDTRRFLRLVQLCEEQLIACKNGDPDQIARILARKEHLLAEIDFAQLQPDSEEIRRAAVRIMRCDSESADALQTHHRKLGQALERLRNGRTTRQGYAASDQGSTHPQLLDARH
jgi:galactokinase